MIEMKNLGKTYGSKENATVALDHVNLAIGQGEFVAIMGKSGAGKSTLLHILGGLDTFDSGEYRLMGKSVGTLKDKSLSRLRNETIGFVMQDFALISEKTVLFNTMLPLFFDKTPWSKMKTQCMAALDRENRVTLPLPRSWLRSPTSTPKPRAEGSSPSAPAKNREASTMLASLFFVSAHKDSATRHGCALRSACRGVSERQWRSAANRPRRQPRPSPSAPATKPAKTLGFRRFSFFMCCMVIWCILVQTAGFRTWFYPFPTAATLSSTQNAPSFAFFWLNRVRFSLFHCFLAAKFSPWFLCNLLHSVYKLKPSVIPCRREVSFLT